LPEIRVTVAIPTLTAGPKLSDCVQSLAEQTCRDFAVVVVDNSGEKLARQRIEASQSFEVIENDRNRGFGAAVNQVFRGSATPFLATLNDDAVAHPGWLAEMLAAIESCPAAGMCASQVRLLPCGRLDSAGMLISADGSSKQRGHLEPPERYGAPGETLLPSGSAALYRRAMLDEIGGFDEDFFLYCEDTDLGLRARWAGWNCVYAPKAVVDHHYSQTAGRATPLKAYYVERNRLFVVAKNFPAADLVLAPLASIVRYAWHTVYLLRGRGAAARFREDGSGSASRLAVLVIRAHWALLRNWSSLWQKRRRIRSAARVTARDFRRLLRLHAIGPREVAQL